MQLSPLHKRFKEISEPLHPIETGVTPVLKSLQNIKVVSYDFYGTLFISGVGDIGIDDGTADAAMLTDVFKKSGVSIQDKSAGKKGFNIYNEVVSRQIKLLKKKGIEYPEPDIRQVWELVLIEMENQNFISIKRKPELFERVSVEFEARMNPVWPIPDLAETLTHFKEQKMAQGIISNSQFYTPIAFEALTGLSLSELGFSEELLHWSFEEKMKKPGLAFYRNYIKKLTAFDANLSPENVLYIGNDMLKDIYPAHQMGMKTALFAGDERSLKWRRDDERCKNLNPDLVITKLEQLKECV